MLIRLMLNIISLSCISLGEVSSLRLMEIRIPTHAVRNKLAVLECNFDLDGEELYSVKWYKDGNEFYRYVPKNNPPGQKFNLPGIYVDELKSTENILALSPVTLQSSGLYRCEVSAEAPSFQTVQDEANMTVVALPDVGPTIQGAFSRYKIGEKLSVTCTSGKSKPATELSWLLNGQDVPPSHLRGPYRNVTGAEELEMTTLRLHFKVRANHFKGSEMKLECIATINPVYSQSRTEIVGNIPRTHPKPHRTLKPTMSFEEKESNMIIVPTEKFFNNTTVEESLNATNETSTATNLVYQKPNIFLTLSLTMLISVIYLITEQLSR